MMSSVLSEDPADIPLPTAPEVLLNYLTTLNIPYDLSHHEAVFTVAESEHVDKNIPGTHCRNMFLRDKKEVMFLVTLANETKVDLKKMESLLNCGRISFGSAQRLWQYLGVRPGSVCPFGVINDTNKSVTLILDAWMMAQERINVHPLINTMSIGLSPTDLIKFLEAIQHPYRVVDLSPAAPSLG